MKLSHYIKKLKNSYRVNKKTFAFYVILRVLVLLTLVRSLLTGNYESAATCVLVLILFLVPAFIADNVPSVFQQTKSVEYSPTSR